MSIVKNVGCTPTENWLGELCERTFLKLWSYPSVFKNQGGPKEICDLLVVFDRQVFILSDKMCKLTTSGDPRTDWNRWYSRAVKKSANQVHTAERWIRKYPSRVFVDSECKQRIPIRIPDWQEAEVHRIVVAHGSYSRSAQFWNGDGDLVINSALSGDDHVWSDKSGGDQLPPAFQVGNVTPSRGWVHVFDTAAIELVLRCFDTVTDLSEYLNSRAQLLQSVSVFAPSEADLIGYYFQSFDKVQRRHIFNVPGDLESLGLEEGLGADFFESAAYKSRQREDERSYAWDTLVNKFAHHTLIGDQHHRSHNEPIELEPLLRFLAKPRRLFRRILAEAIIDAVNTTTAEHRRIRYLPPMETGAPYFVFLVLPRHPDTPEQQYREQRGALLAEVCHVVRLLHEDASDVVGIATENGDAGSFRSEDAIHFDGRQWTEADAEAARLAQSKLRILVTPTQLKYASQEFPTSHVEVQKTGRNAKCPCGSGRKYKHCCLRVRNS